jgi:hypothetical protein
MYLVLFRITYNCLTFCQVPVPVAPGTVHIEWHDLVPVECPCSLELKFSFSDKMEHYVFSVRGRHVELNP